MPPDIAQNGRRMARSVSMEALWNSAQPSSRTFEPEMLSSLPAVARKYLKHAIRSGAPLASAMRLRMHGEIKAQRPLATASNESRDSADLRRRASPFCATKEKLGRWLPFTAEQVIAPDRGMIWNATVRINGMPICGFDRLIEGQGRNAVEIVAVYCREDGHGARHYPVHGGTRHCRAGMAPIGAVRQRCRVDSGRCTARDGAGETCTENPPIFGSRLAKTAGWRLSA